MGLVAGQTRSGQFNGNATFAVSLPAASSASNRVVVFIAGNTTVATPSGWTLRRAEVNQMGHYLWDRAGGGTSFNFTANGQGVWWIGEVEQGVFDIAAWSNATTGQMTHPTPNLTPTAGERIVLASIGSLSGSTARNVASWTNSFTEILDSMVPAADRPLHGLATLEVTASGATAYSTTATFSDTSTGRSAIIAAYRTAAPPAADVRTFYAGASRADRVYAGLEQVWEAA